VSSIANDELREAIKKAVKEHQAKTSVLIASIYIDWHIDSVNRGTVIDIEITGKVL